MAMPPTCLFAAGNFIVRLVDIQQNVGLSSVLLYSGHALIQAILLFIYLSIIIFILHASFEVAYVVD